MKSIFFFLFMAFFSAAHGQSYFQEVANLVASQSLVSDKIDWKEFTDSTKFIRSLHNKDSIDSFNKMTTRYLRRAGDIHSFFMTPNEVNERKQRPQIKDTTGKLLVHSKLIDKIGYIKVPGFMIFDQNEIKAFADTIQQCIQKLDETNNIKGWVVDLRGNDGGNMWPMLAGLNSLIDDGTVGYFVNPSNKKMKMSWISTKGAAGFVKVSYPYKVKKTKANIAILIDSATASSGEMTAISFIGRENTRTFGTPSAGYTTANQTYNLSNGGILNLATLAVMDRNEKIYTGKVYPDEIILENEPGKDAVLDAALVWLEK